MMFIPSLMKIRHLVQKFDCRARRRGDNMSMAPL